MENSDKASEDRVTPLYGYIRNLAIRYCMGRGVTDYDAQQDVIGESMLALVEANSTYKDDAGMEFRTYAHTQVERHLADYFTHRKGSLIPLPEKLSERWKGWKEERNKLSQELGREPSNREWADFLGIDMDEFHKVRDLYAQEYESMDAPIEVDEDGEEVTLHDLMEGTSPDPMDELAAEQERDVLGEFLDNLLPDETSVLYCLYGLGDESGEPMTQEQCAEYLGISRRTVMRHHDQALRKLRGRGLGAALGIDETSAIDMPLSRFE
jgi:RNA polymerase primary sigma factor